MEGCMLCPRRCGVDRAAGQRGFCGADNTVHVARAALHQWEEPCLSGTRGAGTVFFSHCTLGCVYCQNRAISGRQGSGVPVDEARLAAIFLDLQRQGAHNIDLVTPGHYAPHIARALGRAKADGLQIPVVYNCGGYEALETLRLLDGLVDVYLPDFKYYSSYYAARYSGADDYFEVASDAVAEMVRQAGAPVFDGEGLLVRGVLVRHLMLPGLAGDTAQVLRHLAGRFGDRILVSLMRQYTPFGMERDYPELDRTLTEREYADAVEIFQDLGLAGYLQEGEAIGESFIPTWDGTGTAPSC
ncbi:radical SAM protein [Intestinibacillus massiliensis]|uniref:radical SAM protein n=1 Tax=Intestinibacillus massiliensis TaxID=1871029 RepID=UPI000B34B026|nr:radical SAM protein [Intestinibacillus massiliensis]